MAPRVWFFLLGCSVSFSAKVNRHDITGDHSVVRVESDSDLSESAEETNTAESLPVCTRTAVKEGFTAAGSGLKLQGVEHVSVQSDWCECAKHAASYKTYGVVAFSYDTETDECRPKLLGATEQAHSGSVFGKLDLSFQAELDHPDIDYNGNDVGSVEAGWHQVQSLEECVDFVNSLRFSGAITFSYGAPFCYAKYAVPAENSGRRGLPGRISGNITGCRDASLEYGSGVVGADVGTSEVKVDACACSEHAVGFMNQGADSFTFEPSTGICQPKIAQTTGSRRNDPTLIAGSLVRCKGIESYEDDVDYAGGDIRDGENNLLDKSVMGVCACVDYVEGLRSQYPTITHLTYKDGVAGACYPKEGGQEHRDASRRPMHPIHAMSVVLTPLSASR